MACLPRNARTSASVGALVMQYIPGGHVHVADPTKVGGGEGAG